MDQKFYEELQALVGEEAGPFSANDEVNKAMVRHWCEAMEDSNPLYTDEGYAKKSKYGGIMAPPQMVQAFCLPPLWPKGETPPDPLAKAVRKLDEVGYAGVVATTTSQEYFRPMRLGDRIYYRVKLASVSPEKTTRLGKGYFLTSEYIYTNQKGEAVCTQSFTVLKYVPATEQRKEA